MTPDDPSTDETLTPEQATPSRRDEVDAIGETQHGMGIGSGAAGSPALPQYALAQTLGVGGMGEVILAHDRRVGRDIAIKRMRSAHPPPQLVARFLREARIQARLEHPAIVPVHELGHDTNGQPYFTMKRLTGVTLAETLRGEEPPPQHRLLRALVDVCLAIELAHARGVIHRDLKPANIMLGDFGEVYVLDWGVARVVDEHEVVGAVGDITTLDGMTELGAVLGTPGYIPPEQVEGAADVGPPADVYALGAIMFEILTGEPLHPRGAAALRSTLAGRDGSPARRRPDRAIAPELDGLTASALAQDPAARPTARELADRLQRYLDGDRDMERRRALAATELEAARAALAGGDGRRAEAIRSAGRALALDPESREAAAVITRLMLEPPREQPPALAARLAATDAAVHRRQGRAAVFSLCAILAFLAAATLGGLRSVPVLAVLAGWTTAILILAWVASRRSAPAAMMWALVVGNAILAALLSSLFGSLIIAPIVTCVMAVSLTSYPQLMSHARIVIALLVASWLGPVVLERVGVLSTTWQVAEGWVVSTSRLVEVGGTATTVLLIGGNVLSFVVIGLFANALARSRREAQRSVEIQAWHLRQLLPDSP